MIVSCATNFHRIRAAPYYEKLQDLSDRAFMVLTWK